MFESTSSSRRLALRRARLTTILTVAAGAVGASPASAQGLCPLLPGGLINCPAPVPTPTPVPVVPSLNPVIEVTGSVDPLLVTLQDGFTSNGPVNVGTIAGADIDILSQGVSTINSAGPGLTANSGRNLNAQITNISTLDDGATGALLRAADNIIFTSDGLISTLGDNADGVNAQGDAVTLDLGSVTTQGVNALGVNVVSLNGPALVTLDAIDTGGDGSIGALIRAAGDVGLSGNLIRTGGTDAAAFDISNDAAACVVLGAGGCDNTVRLDEVSTDGFGSVGGLVSAVGDTNVNIGVLRTGGDEAAGLDLSADPAACLVLGVGACDTAFTVNNLTTNGARSPGAIVRAVGDIDANVGVLRTGGDQAAGLDLASDPTACAILGAGSCDTSFNVGQLTTDGDGATGLLVRAAGDTTGSVGILRTSGDDAAGIDIASNPTACVIAGVGACDVGLRADDVQTSGNGAAGVLINNTGNAVVSLGRVVTGGNDAAGLSIFQDPAVCLALGPGVCRVQATPANVVTGGDNSPGVIINTPGPVDVNPGTVTTGGDNSPGVAVTSPGPINVVTGPVTTGGDNSDAIRIVGGDQPVTVNAGPIVTTGADSDGVDVTTNNGNQTILAGPITVTGPGSDGIVASSVCGNIAITARDDISSAQGTAIRAASGCSVTVTTLPGASIAGAIAGIDVASGTGATITVGDSVASTAGPAINADGASAAVTIGTTGLVTGRIDLTDSADTVTNGGTLDLAGTSNFGAGADLLTNNRLLRARGTANLAGLEQFNNNGVIDMVDGAADDVLALTGNYAGGAGSVLRVDVANGVTGTPADRLVVGGTTSGATQISLNLLGGTPVANPNGVVLVDAAAGGTGTFTLAGPARVGLIDYSLRTEGGDTRLLALPNALAIEPLVSGRLALDFWYQSADAWSEGAAHRRNRSGRSGIGAWGQAYGSYDTRGDAQASVDVFGTAQAVNLEYETERTGLQGGIDFGGSGPLAFGVTGGYQRAETDFASGTTATADGYNVGGYALFGGDTGFYGELLAKVDFFDMTLDNGALTGSPEMSGKSYGAEAELGNRMVTRGGARIDLNVGLAYVRSELDGFDVAAGSFAFDPIESLRGRIGARITGEGMHHAPFADIKLFHEFMDADGARFVSGGFSLPYADRTGTWARLEAGFGATGPGAGVFVSAWGEAGDVMGLGGRVGIRF